MQPQNSNNQFDFILKDNAKPKSSLGSPLRGLPKPVVIAVAAIGGLILLILFFSLIFGGKSSSYQPLVKVVGQAQDIARVSTTVKPETKDEDTQSLASTVISTLTSQQVQLTVYLKSNKYKLNPKELFLYRNGTISAQLNTAIQNNSLDQTYVNYLKSSLTAYQSSLSTAYKTAGPKAKAILSDDYDSVQTILSAPQFSTGS
jgi:hypothetical protein